MFSFGKKPKEVGVYIQYAKVASGFKGDARSVSRRIHVQRNTDSSQIKPHEVELKPGDEKTFLINGDQVGFIRNLGDGRYRIKIGESGRWKTYWLPPAS